MPSYYRELNEQLCRLPTDDDEHAMLRTRMIQLLDHGEACFQRDFFQPGHFTASAFILSPDQGSLLLIFHAKLNLWLQPGGHIEREDESPLAAARREAAEEVGISNLELLHSDIFDIDIHAIPSRGAEPKHEHFDLRYLFVAPNLDFRAASDAMKAKWVPWADLEAVHSDTSVMRTATRIQSSQNA